MNILANIIPILCLAGLIAHTLSNWLQDFGSELTEVETMMRNLTDLPFPVLFQLSVTPAFKTERLAQLGYGQPIYYFAGESSEAHTFLGWNEPNKSVREIFFEFSSFCRFFGYFWSLLGPFLDLCKTHTVLIHFLLRKI